LQKNTSLPKQRGVLFLFLLEERRNVSCTCTTFVSNSLLQVEQRKVCTLDLTTVVAKAGLASIFAASGAFSKRSAGHVLTAIMIFFLSDCPVLGSWDWISNPARRRVTDHLSVGVLLS
jgi:hypothetical protein